MICALSGKLRSVEKGRVQLQSGAILYELMVPAADFAQLQGALGQELTLHTILYLEGDAARGNLEPRLIGFLRSEDRRFFNLFTTVKGIGAKTALRALTVSVGQIAQAIEGRDTRFLVSLDGVGKRTAELIVAELAGKLGDFVGGPAAKVATVAVRPSHEEDALSALVALGERRADAERLLDSVKGSHPGLKTTDALLREMLRLRS